MWYSVIDLKDFRCDIIKDKKVVAKKLGISVPTLDKKMNGQLVFLHGRFIIGKAEPEKSKRGSNQ